MRLADRLDQVADDHARVREAQVQARVAILKHQVPPAPTPRPITRGEPPPPVPRRSWRSLLEAWDAFDQSLTAHLDRERDEIHPRIRAAIAAGLAAPAELAEPIGRMHDAHQDLRRLAAALRAEAMTAESGKKELRGLLELVTRHIRVDELEVYAAALAGSLDAFAPGAEEASSEKYKTSDDVARSLRSNRPAPPREPEPEKPKPGLMAAIQRMFGKR
jgi:hypothetical protein